jgi:hypothetical protein
VGAASYIRAPLNPFDGQRPGDPAVPVPVVAPVPSIVNWLQIVIQNTPNQQILSLNAKRLWVIIFNAGSGVVFLAPNSLTNATTGFPLPPNQSITVPSYPLALYGFATGPTLVGIIEAIA